MPTSSIEYNLKYYYDNWSNTGPSQNFRHQIVFMDSNDSVCYSLSYRNMDSFIEELYNWCDENIGVVGRHWETSRHNATFYFSNEADALAFKIRWS